MNFETVRYEDHESVRTIELNRPEALNAFSNQLFDDLTEAFLQSTADSSVKVVILTGAGRAFSAGADLQEMGRARSKPKHGLDGLLEAILEFPKPLIIAVNGLGVGIGATICGLADFCFMAEEARLRCPFSALGLTAEVGSTYTFPQLMGRQRASWFLMAAEWMSGEECARAGLVLEAVPLARLMDTVNEKARVLAGLPLASLEKTKSLIVAPHKAQLRATIAAENKGLADLMGSPGNVEALAAFREKRQPDFSGI